MNTNIVSREDINYLAQQSTSNLNMILSGMTALLNDNDSKVAMLENQTWFQRMCRTVSGKNKMTQQEIQRNHDKINAYMTQAMTELYEQQCIDRQIMMSLGNQLNELYAEHLQLKQMLGAFVSKLNEKIESIDNFHMLNTEIEQGVYSDSAPIVSVCKILSQMDKRCIQDYRKMNILRRSMATKNILGGEPLSLAEYLMSIAEIPMEEVGQIYLELSSLRGNFMANIILNMMENYHFLSDIARKMKNKALLVQGVIEQEQLEPTMTLSIDDVYDDLVNSKLDMIEGLVPISAIQYDSKLTEAEKLFLEYKLDEAFVLFKTLAEKGNGRAMYFLGEYYTQPYGSIEQNKEIAKTWRLAGRDAGDILAALNVAYTLPENSSERREIFNELFTQVLQLAENDDIFAQDELACLYDNGYGTNENQDEKLHWWKESAEQGYWRTMNELGDHYYSEKNYVEANKWYRKAAERGYHWGMHNLAVCYKDGTGCEQDYSEALKWFQLAYENGNGSAANWIGIMFYNGLGVTVDGTQEFLWMKRSADLGYAQGMSNLGNCYCSGRGTAQDYHEAMKWYLKASDKGNAGAQFEIGVLYYYGRGVNKDQSEAVKWFKKAAENGNVSAKRDLGYCYKNGQGVEKDIIMAKKWYIAASDAGNDYSTTQVGIIEMDSGNYDEAIKWFKKAAENGYADAQNRLGVRYVNGEGVPKDRMIAFDWFIKAAEQGHDKAQRNVAILYYDGDSIPRDLEKAKAWIIKSAKQGNKDAKRDLWDWFSEIV